MPEFDLAVVGAGIVGLSCALASAGFAIGEEVIHDLFNEGFAP
jgi:thioredoxin reductase